MPRPDYKRLLNEYKGKYKILKPEVGLLYQAKAYDPDTIKDEADTDYKKYEPIGVDIDIFPLDGIVNDQNVIDKLYKRELFSNIRFPYGKFGEDLFVMPWIYYRCDSIASVSENLYYYVLTLNSISRRDYTVWHLDSVEAYYNMMQFCQNNGFPDLLEKISAKMTDSYIVNIERIKRILPKDKQRVREIRKMVLYGIFKYGKDVRLVHKLYIVSPHIYHFLLRAKRKLFMFLQ